MVTHTRILYTVLQHTSDKLRSHYVNAANHSSLLLAILLYMPLALLINFKLFHNNPSCCY